MIRQLALFFFLLLFYATNGLSRGLQVRGSREVLGRHFHIVLGLVKFRVVCAIPFSSLLNADAFGTEQLHRLPLPAAERLLPRPRPEG